MSRIGNKPVEVPAAVDVAISAGTVTVKGAKGSLSYRLRPEVAVDWDAASKTLTVTRRDDQKASKAYHGLTRALLANMVQGVSAGFKKELEIVGVGWTAKLAGKKLALNVGYADTRELEVPAGVNVEVAGQRITVSGSDKQSVGQFAARARAQRPPEPYNGKGIKYVDEVIVRKEGKAFAGG